MIQHKDEIPTFIPHGKVRFIILGTMGSINARSIDGVKPKGDFFYYNNNRNHFWKVIQLLFEPNSEPQKKMTVPEKKLFLEKQGIAIINIVDEVQLLNKQKNDPSDTVLFEADKKNRVLFKKAPQRLKKILMAKPIFFTCRRKPGIENLLKGFLKENNLSLDVLNNIWYWPTPTRCNPKARGLLWKQEMDSFLETIANNK